MLIIIIICTFLYCSKFVNLKVLANQTYIVNVIMLNTWKLEYFCWIKVEKLLGERATEKKELELVTRRVEELQQEKKSGLETIGQLSAQRDELMQLCHQHSDDLSALRKVSSSVVSSQWKCLKKSAVLISYWNSDIHDMMTDAAMCAVRRSHNTFGDRSVFRNGWTTPVELITF